MAQNSKIEWTHHTFQAWEGCTKVSPGCQNCYAEALSKRWGRGWGPKSPRKLMSEAYWQQPLKWNRKAEQVGERHRVFCASLADVFEGFDTMPSKSEHPVTEARRRLFQLIEETPALDWLLLTKRPQNIMRFVPFRWHDGFPSNVWVGTSAENQETANERLPKLLRIPAKVRFLSCEPLLGPISLHKATPCNGYYCDVSIGHIDCLYWRDHLHLVIVGGESGVNARPMHPDWVRSLRNQCVDTRVRFFFKQHGEFLYGYQCGERLEELAPLRKSVYPTYRFPDGTDVWRVGKKLAGRVLDGRTWDEFPEVAV